MSAETSEQPRVNPPKRKNWFLRTIFALLILLLILIGGVWIWSGSNGSLKQGLSFAQQFLKPGQVLVANNVEGSLRHGGSIGSLTFQQDDSFIELSELQWQIGSLSFSSIELNTISVQRVQVIPGTAKPQDTTPPVPEPTSQSGKVPPERITLPVMLDIKQFHIGEVIIGSDQSKVLASNIDMSYRYDDVNHLLHLANMHAADGDYQGQLSLGAETLQLAADLTGQLTTQIPGRNQPIIIDTKATANGLLTAFNVNADIQAQQTGQATNLPKFDLQALVKPWAAFPVPELDLNMISFNARALLANAPETLISGSAKIQTAEQAALNSISQIHLDLKNANAGTLDASKLPVTALTGDLVLQDELLTISRLNILIQQGSINVKGRYALSGMSPWQLEAQLTNIDPHLLQSTLGRDQISGTATASLDTAQNAINFTTQLKTAHAANVPYFRVNTLNAQGHYALTNNVVTFSQLSVHGVGVSAQTNSLQYALNNQAVSGPLNLTVPGMQASVALSALTEASGSAQVHLKIESVKDAIAWLRTQPVNLKPLLDFLVKAEKYVQNLANYVELFPVAINNGWKNPQVTLQIDVEKLITRLIEEKAGQRLQEELGISGDNPLGSILSNPQELRDRLRGGSSTQDQKPSNDSRSTRQRLRDLF